MYYVIGKEHCFASLDHLTLIYFMIYYTCVIVHHIWYLFSLYLEPPEVTILKSTKLTMTNNTAVIFVEWEVSFDTFLVV